MDKKTNKGWAGQQPKKSLTAVADLLHTMKTSRPLETAGNAEDTIS